MDLKLLRFLSASFSKSSRRQRFLSFARMTALISVMLGSMALIIAFAVLDGFDEKLHENAVKFTAHIIIKSFKSEPLENVSGALETINTKFPEVQKAAPLIEKEGLLRAGSNVDGIIIRGIKKDYDITGIYKNIVAGNFNYSHPDSNEVVLSRRLANKMEIKLGQSIILYSIGPGSTTERFNPKIKKFKVIGFYETGMVQYDDVMVYIPYEKAVDFFDYPPNSASLIQVLLDDIDKAQGVAMHMSPILDYPYQPMTVFDYHQSIFSWIELQKVPIPIVLGLISIVAFLNIITTLLITVVEKTSAIGILRALGMDSRTIMSMFIFQGVSLAFAGTVIGSLIGYIVCLIQLKFKVIQLEGELYFLDSLPIHFELWHYGLVIGASVLLAFLATLIPSSIALRISPVKAIRFK